MTFRDARRAFLDLDLNGSGTITLQDFESHMLERDPDLDEGVIQETFQKLDVARVRTDGPRDMPPLRLHQNSAPAGRMVASGPKLPSTPTPAP